MLFMDKSLLIVIVQNDFCCILNSLVMFQVLCAQYVLWHHDSLNHLKSVKNLVCFPCMQLITQWSIASLFNILYLMVIFLSNYWAQDIAQSSHHTIISMTLFYNKSYWCCFLESFGNMPVLAGGKRKAELLFALCIPLYMPDIFQITNF